MSVSTKLQRGLASAEVLFLQDFCADPEPFVFIDSHAGRGLYALDGGLLIFHPGLAQYRLIWMNQTQKVIQCAFLHKKCFHCLQAERTSSAAFSCYSNAPWIHCLALRSRERNGTWLTLPNGSMFGSLFIPSKALQLMFFSAETHGPVRKLMHFKGSNIEAISLTQLVETFIFSFQLSHSLWNSRCLRPSRVWPKEWTVDVELSQQMYRSRLGHDLRAREPRFVQRWLVIHKCNIMAHWHIIWLVFSLDGCCIL